MFNRFKRKGTCRRKLEHFSALTGSPITNLKTGLRGLYKSERNRT